jgi:hypothetical protein
MLPPHGVVRDENSSKAGSKHNAALIAMCDALPRAQGSLTATYAARRRRPIIVGCLTDARYA